MEALNGVRTQTRGAGRVYTLWLKYLPFSCQGYSSPDLIMGRLLLSEMHSGRLVLKGFYSHMVSSRPCQHETRARCAL